MTYEVFQKAIEKTLPPGTILENPGGGTTKVITYSGNIMMYERGNSSIPAPLKTFYKVLIDFRGKKLSSTDLKKYSSKFDSTKSGHNCNCTTLFLILLKLGYIDKILGSGRANDPFYVKL